MNLIGVISDVKSFENIKRYIKKSNYGDKVNIINITKTSIENIRNIKFELLIINKDLKEFKGMQELLEKICINSKFIILNSDLNLKIDPLKNKIIKVITFGLNQKSTITISSIDANDVIVSLQRNIENMKKHVIEVEEKHIRIEDEDKINHYDILIIYAIFIMYDYKIMEQI